MAAERYGRAHRPPTAAVGGGGAVADHRCGGGDADRRVL